MFPILEICGDLHPAVCKNLRELGAV